MIARVLPACVTLLVSLVLAIAAGCASPPAEPPQRQPYKVVLLPVEGAARALAAQQDAADVGGAMVPLALTPEEFEAAIFAGVKSSNAFSELIEAPASVRAAGGAFAGDELAAAADFARRSNADLILRITVKSARMRDLGNNSATFWSTFTWFMVPLPIWTVDDRTYDTDLTVEAALYEPRDTVKPTASVVASSGRQDLDLWDRGLSFYVPVIPPAFLAGDDKKVSETVTAGAVRQLMDALVKELRTREIPTRFDLDLTATADGVTVTAGSRRQLRSLEVYAGGKLVQQWAETELVAEKDSTAERRVYRRTVAIAGLGAATAKSAPVEVRVVAEDEAGGREVRTIVLGRRE